MIDTLIVEDDLHYVKNILNTVLNKIQGINIRYISTTVKETIEYITNNSIDLIFLDLKLLDGNGIKIIEQLELLNTIKKPNVIIISGDTNLIQNVREKYHIYDVISKLQYENHMYNIIKQLVHEMEYINIEDKIKEKVICELTSIGYNFKYKGTIYIFESITYIYKSNNFELLDNLEKNVYKYISYKYKKSLNNIKTNIIKATENIPKKMDIIHQKQ